MCQGRTQPIAELCELFDTETNNGNDTSKYNDLLRRAINEISRVFKFRSSQKLVSDRGALLIPQEKQVRDADNFELVTWLVIK